MKPITIYHFITSPPSWTVRMMASILQLPMELKETKIYKLEQKTPEFRKMNPVGAVPTIKDGDFYLGESHAIIKYLLEKYGKEEYKSLYPKDLVKRAVVDQINFFNAGVAFVHLKNMAGVRKGTDFLSRGELTHETEELSPKNLSSIFEGRTEFSPRGIKNAEDVYETLEMFINKQNYVANNEFSMADLSIGSTMLGYDCLHKIDPVKYQSIVAWLERLRDKPVFQEVAVPGSKCLAEVVFDYQRKNREKKANQS